MTSREAYHQIEVCEKQLVDNFENMRKNAEKVGESALSAARKATLINTMLPLLLSLFGLLIMDSTAFGGVLLIAGGIFLAISSHANAKTAKESIIKEKETLDASIKQYHAF